MANLAHTPWKNVRTFLMVVRLNSFQKAADALFITPSAVSQQIHQLEQFFEEKLLVRNAKRLSLTPVGKAYFDNIDQAFKEIELNTQKILDHSASEFLNIGTTVSFNMYWLLPNLYKFEELYPDVKINIHVGSKNFVSSDSIENTNLDLAIYHLKDSELNANTNKLFRNILYPVCSQETLLKLDLKEDIWAQIKDLKIPLIGSYIGSGEFDWEEWLSAKSLGPCKEFRLRNFKYYAHAQQGAMSSLGVCLARSVYVQPYLKTGQLNRLGSEEIESYSSLNLIERKGSSCKKNITLFKDWVVKETAFL